MERSKCCQPTPNPRPEPEVKPSLKIMNSNVPPKYKDPRTVKISFLGNISVGKSLYYAVTKDNVDDFIDLPTGPEGEFCIKYVQLDKYGRVLGILWDCAGNEEYYSITKSIINSTNCVMLLYAIDEIASFINQKNYWIKRIGEVLDFKYDNVMLIGNKVDLAVHDKDSETPGVPLTDEERKKKGFVTYKDGFEFAKMHGFLFEETSAKTGYNVSATLKKLITANLDARGKADFNEDFKYH